MNKYALLSFLYTTFGSLFYGYDSGLTTSIIGYPEFIKYFNFNSTTLGALGSVYYAGNFIGGVTNIWLPDKVGRLRAIQIASIISIIGCGMQTGAKSLPVLLVGRAIGGVACGIVFSVCPTFGSELVPARMRGHVGGMYNNNLNFAYMVVEWMGLGFSYIKGGELKWRIFLAIQIVCALIMLVGSIWMPESPRWLIQQDRHAEALVILEKLHGEKQSSDPPPAEEISAGVDEVPFYRREYNQIEAQIALEKANPQVSLMSILRNPSYRRRFLIISFFFCGQQFTGILALQNYQVLLYKALGLGGRMSLILVGVWGTTVLLIGIVAGLLFDKLGRRPNLFISITTLTIGSTMLVGFWARFEQSGNSDSLYGHLAIFSMFFFLLGYGWNMNAFAYTYTPEIMPMEIRATGMAFGFAVKTAVVVLLIQCTPLAIEAISWRYFMIFVFTDVIFGIGAYFWFPETANVPLEEIAKLFGDEVVMTLDEASTDAKTALTHFREERGEKGSATHTEYVETTSPEQKS